MVLLFNSIKGITYIVSFFIKVIVGILHIFQIDCLHRYIKLYCNNFKQSKKTDEASQNFIISFIINFIRKVKNIIFYGLSTFFIFLRKYDLVDLICICTRVFIRGSYSIELYEIESFKQICKENNLKYTVLEEMTERTVCKPEFYRINKDECQNFLSPEIYYCELEHIEVLGESSLVFYKKECLYDAFFNDTEKRYDLLFSSVRKVLKNSLVIEYKKSKREIDSAIFLLGFASFNYYHLTVEIISRLAYIDHIPEYQSWPILVDKVVLEVPQYKELLKAINIYNHPIISIEPYERIIVKKMLYVSYNSWMPINVKDRMQIKVSDFMIADSAIHNLRGRLLNTGNEIQPYRKLFISRKNTKTLRLKNELQVRELFQKAGFEIIYTEEISFWQQIQYFQEAKYIVATSGGALTNIIYCQKNAVLTCIIPKEFEFYMYSTIAERVGIKCIFLDAQITEHTSYSASDVFEADLFYCESFIRNYC